VRIDDTITSRETEPACEPEAGRATPTGTSQSGTPGARRTPDSRTDDERL
jgi:hypothetical protein